MTCKFCGSFLEDNETECPYCGHPVEVQTNESDSSHIEDDKPIDLLSKFGVKKNQAPDSAKNRNKVSKPFSSVVSSAVAKKIPLTLPVFAGLILSLILLLICMFLTISTRNKVSDLYQDMLSQLYQIQTSNEQLTSKLDSITGAVNNVGTTIENQNLSRNITIKKQPTSVATWLGRTDKALIFSVEAESQGDINSMTWQKLDNASGNWVNVNFDVDGNCAEYGIQLYDDHWKGISKISAIGVTDLAFGSYQCVIEDNIGIAKTDTVKLEKIDKPTT